MRTALLLIGSYACLVTAFMLAFSSLIHRGPVQGDPDYYPGHLPSQPDLVD